MGNQVAPIGGLNMGDTELLLNHYKDFLASYLEGKTEQALYKGQQFSRKMIEQQVSPEEVVSLHFGVLQEIYQDLPLEVKHSFEFLIEVMMGYGLAYREHQSLRDRQLELESEIDVAASMQQTLLQGDVPSIESLDIGVISQPAKKMNGDYYHFVKDDHDCLGVAVADIIGKGIPAALCMSMIKYAMDSLPEQRHQPNAVLESINRVVEQNIHANMFITMLYGIYDPRVHQFYYSSAGHEPGFHYISEKDDFEDMNTKGLVLGVSRTTKYREYQKEVHLGDMIILLSDGVTECRTSKGFIEREEIVSLIRSYMHLPAQEIVQSVYADLERLQDFELRDDFTLIILRRNV
jgi:sigma-B regulation protein RsbU (phosphoserine phosphatase)